jgi:hypothetical protein
VDVHDDLAQAGVQSPAFLQKMTAPYYALIARCGQLIQGQ